MLIHYLVSHRRRRRLVEERLKDLLDNNARTWKPFLERFAHVILSDLV